jgi:hypothetical protein
MPVVMTLLPPVCDPAAKVACYGDRQEPEGGVGRESVVPRKLRICLTVKGSVSISYLSRESLLGTCWY